ncbi:hypothetical protein ACIRBX_25760 [Kitasatospora sp. NPDC096147]|uniref:hypothetical protein n=1 Tax=Kitasatospora sp. NPDC096147 TaxID=3364093 RepID=UPI003803E6C1
MNVAEALISSARQGRFDETLPDLVRLATRSDGDRDEAWEAAAAAVQVLSWRDRFAEAADLVEALILRDGSLGGELCDQDVPFSTIFLAAELYADQPARPRLLAAADRMPQDCVLAGDLTWLADEVTRRPLEELLPSYFDWGGSSRPLDGQVESLAVQGFDTLDSGARHALWQGLTNANDFERAHQVAESAGAVPDRYASCLWMAGWYATQGDLLRGERMLLAARERWWPYKAWDAVPDDPVLQPALRLVVTDRVREQYLTRPIGPEAAEKKE